MLPRRLVASAVLAVVALVAAPATVGQAQPRIHAGAARTTVAHLSPLTAGGRLKAGYSVTHNFSFASCEAGSEATGNAYRCFAGKSNHSLNHVLDPCWVEGNSRYAICDSAPWSFHVTELTVSKGYDNSGRSTKHAKLPWGVQLTNGVQCVFLQGAGATVHGKRVNYACTHSKVVLYGAVNTSKRTWSIGKATSHGGGFTAHGRAKLAIVWFGQASRKG